jgi:hypothetical protein
MMVGLVLAVESREQVSAVLIGRVVGRAGWLDVGFELGAVAEVDLLGGNMVGKLVLLRSLRHDKAVVEASLLGPQVAIILVAKQIAILIVPVLVLHAVHGRLLTIDLEQFVQGGVVKAGHVLAGALRLVALRTRLGVL